MRTADVCPTCATYTNALCVIYDGPLLTTLDIQPQDNLQVILQKIEAFALVGDPGSSIITQDEGVTVDLQAGVLNFVGAGVTATDAGSNITVVTVPGEVNDLTQSVTWTDVPDPYITLSSVQQHQSFLVITESQISDLSHNVYDLSRTGAPNTIHNNFDIVLDENTVPKDTLTLVQPTGFESITEVNQGWRLIGKDPANYGDIGAGAIDGSWSDTVSSVIGATGDSSTSFGYENQVAGYGSFASGWWNTMTGDDSIAMGSDNILVGFNSMAIGAQNSVNGGTGVNGVSYAIALGRGNTVGYGYSGTLGLGLTVDSMGCVAVGQHNIPYGTDHTFNPTATPAFLVGIGNATPGNNTVPTLQKDGFFIMRTGEMRLPQYISTNFDGSPTSMLGVDASGNVVKSAPVVGGATNWLALTDTDPANYTGSAGYLVRVNATPNGLEFVDGSTLFAPISTNFALIAPVENQYFDNTAMFADQINQTTSYIQYVSGTDTYYEYLGTTVGDLTDYRELSADETTIINGKRTKPVHKIYANAAAMYADQKKQINGFIYRTSDDDQHYEYLGTFNGDATDYKPFGAAGGIITQDEGILVDAAATTLNFIGAGVTAADAGGNVTSITIPGGLTDITGETLSDLSDVPDEPTGGVDLHYLVWDDNIDTFTWTAVTCCDLQGTTDVGNVTTNGVYVLHVNDAYIYKQGTELDTYFVGSVNTGGSNTGSYVTGMGHDALRVNTQNYASAFGYDAGENNIGTNFTAMGYRAGQNNTGASVTAFGYYAGRAGKGQGTYIGYEAGDAATGSNLTVVGYRAGNDSTSINMTAVGYNAGRTSAGNSVTFIGNGAGENNTESYVEGVGWGAAAANTGRYSTIIGHYAGRNNSGQYLATLGYYAGTDNTGTEVVAVGSRASEKNNGDYATNTGIDAGRLNEGDNSVGTGWRALEQNIANNTTGVGHLAGEDNAGTNNTYLGYMAGVFVDDTPNAKTVANAATDVDVALNRITIASHGFVNNAEGFINLKFSTTGSLPGGFNVNGDVYKFTVIDINTIEKLNDTINSTGTDTHTLTPQIVYTNSTAVGANSIISGSNQVTLGDSGITELVSGNYKFNVGQTVGAGQDNYVLTYDNGTGQISLEAAAGGGGGTIITQDEGIQVDAAATTLNFVGTGVTATNAGAGVTTVTIPDTTFEGYFESGTRAGGNLFVAIGDHDASSNDTQVFIDDASESVYVAKGNGVLNTFFEFNVNANTPYFNCDIYDETALDLGQVRFASDAMYIVSTDTAGTFGRMEVQKDGTVQLISSVSSVATTVDFTTPTANTTLNFPAKSIGTYTLATLSDIHIATQDDGVGVTAEATTLNFTGAGVTVTDAGAGVSTIDIPGGGGGATPRTVFVDLNLGNDGTAVVGDDSLPYKTIEAAFSAMTNTEAERHQLWTLVVMDSAVSSVTTTGSFPQRRLQVRVEDTSPFTWTLNPTNDDIVDTPINNESQKIEVIAPQTTFNIGAGKTIEYNGASFNPNSKIYWECDTFNFTNGFSNFGCFRNIGGHLTFICENLTTSGAQATIFLTTNKGRCDIRVNNLLTWSATSSSSALLENAVSGSVYIEEYNKDTTTSMYILDSCTEVDLKVLTFSGTGTGSLYVDRGCKDMVHNLDFLNITSATYTVIYGYWYDNSTCIITGNMNPNSEGIQPYPGNFTTGVMIIENFYGRFGSSINTLGAYTISDGTFKLVNSTVYCEHHFMTANANTIDARVSFEGFNTIILDDAVTYDIVNNVTPGSNLNINGELRTNAADLGPNVTGVYGATVKFPA